MPSRLSVLCWNIGNPSLERARKQAEWLSARKEDAIVLTEAKNSEGCAYIERLFRFYKGYNVVFPKPEGNEYAVMILSRLPLKHTEFAERVVGLRSRVASVEINGLELIGVYAPTSTSTEPAKVDKKKGFLDALLRALDDTPNGNRIFCGDFNILEPGHVPHHPAYVPWQWFYQELAKRGLVDGFKLAGTAEHSWFSRDMMGYRFDHCFVSNELASKISKCLYDRKPMEAKLSDHAAMVLDVL
ncbi:MAG: endonuclease/exonuclease/phosphatase family protein [Candidatus Aenigmatarchaeota archaeon]|nr:MAG: endonuclease/exonuclease/phosphatase family protein [Candidatus Aenigmarchaeota archaeon]